MWLLCGPAVELLFSFFLFFLFLPATLHIIHVLHGETPPI